MSLVQIYLRAIGYVAIYRNQLIWIVLANIALSAFAIAEPVLFGHVVDAIATARPFSATIGLWLGVALSGALITFLTARGSDRLAHKRRQRLLADAYEKILGLPVAWHVRNGSPETVNTLLRASEALFGIWLEFFRTQLASFLSLVFLIPTAMSMDLRLTAVLVVLGLVYLVINSWVVNATRARQGQLEGHYQDVFGHVSDTIANISIISAYNRIGREAAMLREKGDRLIDAQIPVLNWWAISGTLNRIAATFSMTAVLLISIYLLRQGEIRIGSILAFIGFANIMIGRLDQARAFVAQIFDARPRLEAFYRLEDLGNEHAARGGTIPARATRGRVEFRNVTFRHDGTSAGVRDVSLVVEPGETVAIVGRTGSGKTTLLNLLQRTHEPAEGCILLDDFDIARLDFEFLKRQIAVVFQDGGILNRSIGENIALGVPDASMSRIGAAARVAQADAFVVARPQGYETIAGERGNRLSGGERQRIAIARAILKDAPVLVLDEATSALDVETEALVKRAIDEARKDKTTFIVAHRLSTVRDADLVIVMDEGRIVETGSYAALARAGGRFAAFLAESGMAADEAFPENARAIAAIE